MPVQFINSARTYGYQARVGQKQGDTKFFACVKYGGEKAAEAAARAYERRMLITRYGSETPPWSSGYRVNVQRNNLSGIPGISAVYRWSNKLDKSKGYPVLYFTATWFDKKQRKQRRVAYSTEKNGLLGALTMALEQRARGAGFEMPNPRSVMVKIRKDLRIIHDRNQEKYF